MSADHWHVRINRQHFRNAIERMLIEHYFQLYEKEAEGRAEQDAVW